MKKRLISLALTLCLLLSLLPPLTTHAAVLTFSGGTGTPTDPYLISTAAQLQSLNSDTTYLSKSYRLMNDIELYNDFTTLGCTGETAEVTQFTGSFDGAGYGIYCYGNGTVGMYARTAINGYNAAHLYVGLFAELSGATVKNLKIKDMNAPAITVKPKTDGGTSYVGGIAGRCMPRAHKLLPFCRDFCRMSQNNS